MMDAKKARKLQRNLEKAIIEVVIRLGLRNLPLLHGPNPFSAKDRG
jgi:hypothetical protein